MNEESRSDETPEQKTPPATASRSPTRFLGSRPDLRGLARGRAASRLFATVSALVFLSIILAAILLSFRNQLGDRVLLTAAVPDYQSPLVRPLDFVQQDLDTLRSAAGFDLGVNAEDVDVGNFSTESDLSRLVNEVLPVVDHDSLIVFVRMHAVSTSTGLYLLPADATANRPQEGLRLSQLLNAVADSPARNKLVLMDVAPIGDLKLGWFGNDAQWHVEREFEILESRPDPVGNLHIVCSAGDGQASWSSVSVQQSVFAAVAGYCLHGGAQADGSGPNGRRDSLLSAGEIAAYLEQSVADWSLIHRGVLQKPYSLSIGSDFPVAGVSEFLTVESFFSDLEPLSRAGEERKERRLQELAEQSELPAAVNEGEASAEEAPPTAESVVGRLLLAWQRHGELATTMSVVHRPRHWTLFFQELQRAERLLLAGRIDDADDVLNVSIGPLESDLATPQESSLRYPWSLTLVDLLEDDAARQQLSGVIANAVAAPTRSNLDQLTGSPFIEAALLHRLSQRMVAGTTDEGAAWSDPELLQTVIATQTLAERAAGPPSPPDGEAGSGGVFSEPFLLAVLKASIEEADRFRITAEHESLLGRLDAARVHFDLASGKYESEVERTGDVSAQMAELHRTLLEAASIMEWLSRTRRDEVWWIQTAQRFDAFLDGVVEFRKDPRIELLPALVLLSSDLRRTAESAAREAVQTGDPVELRATLELPFLEPETRSQVLSAILGRTEPVQHVSGLRRFARSTVGGVASPFSTGTLYRGLAIEQLSSDLLRNTDPGSRGFVRRAQETDESLRGQRIQLGEAFGQMLTDLNADPLSLPPGSSSYEQFVVHLLRAPFQSRLLQLTRFRPLVTDELFGRMSIDYLSWQLSRLQRAASATRIDVSGPRLQIARNIREIDPSYPAAGARAQQAFTASAVSVRALTSGSRVALMFDVTTVLHLSESDRPRFVLDWFDERDGWSVMSVRNRMSGEVSMSAAAEQESPLGDNAGSSRRHPWRIAVPVQGLVTGGPVSIEIDLQHQNAAESSQIVEQGDLTGWIELGDGSRYWMAIPFELKPDVLPPFAVQWSGPDGELLPDRVDLFPNQQFPVGIHVVSRTAEPPPITIAIGSGDVERLIDVTLDDGAGATPVLPDRSFQLPVADARINLRVIHNSETVADQGLAVNILNPLTSFRPEVSFDTDTLTVTAAVRRLVNSVSNESVPVALELIDTPIEGGNLRAAIDSAQNQVELNATVSSDPSALHYNVSLGVCGVPRLFHYRIDATTGLVTRVRKTSVSIIEPDEGTAFAQTMRESTLLPVRLAVDCEGTCVVNVGIDGDGDQYLDDGERLGSEMCWSGRSVATVVRANADPAGFLLESRVSDVSVPIFPSGLVGPQEILAQLISGNRVLTAARKVYFVQTAPPVEFETPRADEQIALGDHFTVVLRTDDPAFHAIERIEVGVDRNNNGEWDENETLTSTLPAEDVALRFRQSNRVSDVFDSSELLTLEDADALADVEATGNGESILPRRVVLLARTTLRTHNIEAPDEEPAQATSPVVRRVIELISQADKPVPTGSISGHVITVDGLRQRDVLISIGEQETQSDDDGRILLEDVPVGVHVLQAQRGRRTGQVEVEVTAGTTTEDVEVVIVR